MESQSSAPGNKAPSPCRPSWWSSSARYRRKPSRASDKDRCSVRSGHVRGLDSLPKSSSADVAIGISHAGRRVLHQEAPFQLSGKIQIETNAASRARCSCDRDGVGALPGARARLCAARAKVVGFDAEGRDPRELSAVRSTTGPTQMSVSTFRTRCWARHRREGWRPQWAGGHCDQLRWGAAGLSRRRKRLP